VVHRSDGSGTTFNFTDYLSKVSADWKSKVGEGTAVQWPTGIGGKGNEGVAAYIKQIPNSIGYVEYAYALTNHLGYAKMKNAAGNVVEPNTASFQAAANTADWKNAKDFNLLMTNAPGERGMADHRHVMGHHVQDAEECCQHQGCFRLLQVGL
jgi:phosphate transport system substrate-binding protein